MSIKAIVFDCDGTLVDSEVLTNEVLVEYLRELGHSMTVGEAVEAYTGMKLAECVADLERRFQRSMPDDFVATFRKRTSMAFALRLRPVTGADALLASLSLPFFVASSGPREKIEHSLSVTGLVRHFSPSSIFSAYEVGAWKPDPAFYRAVLSELLLHPDEVVVVEDSLPGIRSALGAGIRTIALGATARLAGGLTDAIPAPNLASVGELLKRLGAT